MALFDWVKRKLGVPVWGAGFTRAQRATFMTWVATELQAWAMQSTRTTQSIIATAPDGQVREFELKPIAEKCLGQPENAWREAIHEYFLGVFTAHDEARALMHRASQFDTVKHALRINVYAQRPEAAGAGHDLLSFEIADGLFGVVVLDFATTTRSVSEAEIEPWGRSTRELIEVAVSNSLTEPVRREQLALGDDTQVTLFGGGFFTSSRVLKLDKHVPIDHPWGALVAIPNRNTLLLHPIVTVKAMHALQAMALLSHKLFAAGPGGVSPEVFWWRQGVMTRLPLKVEDGGVRIAPSLEFTRMMTELARPN